MHLRYAATLRLASAEPSGPHDGDFELPRQVQRALGCLLQARRDSLTTRPHLGASRQCRLRHRTFFVIICHGFLFAVARHASKCLLHTAHSVHMSQAPQPYKRVALVQVCFISCSRFLSCWPSAAPSSLFPQFEYNHPCLPHLSTLKSSQESQAVHV